MKQFFQLVLILFFTVSITAQNPNRIFKKASVRDGDYLEVQVNDGIYNIKFYSPEIVETTFLPSGEAVKALSHAVIHKPYTGNIKLNDNGKIIHFSSEGISVQVQKQPFQILYYYKDKFITSEKRGYYSSQHEAMDLVKDNIVADKTEKIEFNLTEDEVLYGGGARAVGMNRRGHRLPLYNRADYGYETHSELMNYTMPIVLSSNKYIIHFDNAPIGYLDLDSKGNNALTYETISGRKTYQILAGESWYDIMDRYTDLTGKQPMLPRWALGNFSSRFGYHSQEETEATIDKFIEEDIPVDAVILDLYWFGKDVKGTMGNLEVFRDSFPDFEGMVKRLNAKGVKTIPITEPFVLTTSKRWREAVDANILAKDSLDNPARYDFYFGNTGIIDIYKPEGEQWFWNIYKGLADEGIVGVWGDLGEPEVHPSWVQHHTGSADEVHNIYGHDWARLVYQGYQRDFPEIRPFILMRAGYSGSQRYGMVPWSGDVNRTWGGLQSQPEIALQMGMQGLAYMHSDLGGFAGANLDDELYVRWLQYGVFNPIYRPHAQEDVPSEPVFRSEKAKALAKEAILLRYRLLPYNYNLVYENNQTGKPLMRPLLFEEPDNPELFNYSKTYLWGNDILVSPVLEAGKNEQEVYFPKTNVWFDFYTDEKFEGGQTKTVQLKENSIPTFVRGGSFIPLAKKVDSGRTTKDYSTQQMELHYYYDTDISKSNMLLYDDYYQLDKDVLSNNMYQLMEFNADLRRKRLKFEFKEMSSARIVPETNQFIELIIHNLQKEPRRIKVKNKSVNAHWDAQTKTLKISLEWVEDYNKEAIKITIKK